MDPGFVNFPAQKKLDFVYRSFDFNAFVHLITVEIENIGDMASHGH